MPTDVHGTLHCAQGPRVSQQPWKQVSQLLYCPQILSV